MVVSPRSRQHLETIRSIGTIAARMRDRLKRGLAQARRCLPAAVALSWALAPLPLPMPSLSGGLLGGEGASLLLFGGEAAEVPALSSPPPPDGLFPVDEQLLLPDLLTLPPTSVEVRRHPAGRVLRFSNTVWNGGEGPLEMLGVTDVAARRTRVVQRAYTAAGATMEWPVGEFVWHPTHTHWHLDGFAIYQLWSLNQVGSLDTLMATSDKVSFCLIDTEIADPDNRLRPAAREYTGCGRGRQGLSVGWGDTYRSYLDGQSLPLDTVEDGLYALVSIANPDGRLRESETGNNTGVVYLAITLDRVTLLPWRAIAKERCLSGGPC
jgi:hypothetical protein